MIRHSMYCAIALALPLAMPATVLADTCHVTTAGDSGNSGADWSAPLDLQSALALSTCSEIWVAAGVYTPTTIHEAREVSFRIDRDVAIYGGFAGTETARDERDPRSHVTVLSGDIDNDDFNDDGNGIAESYSDITGSNSNHVVYLDGATLQPITAATVLDGFTITAGHADGGAQYDSGAGLYCLGTGTAGAGCTPTLAQLVFSGNRAVSSGGAVFNDGSAGGNASPTFRNVDFHGNFASHGGAMYNLGEAGNSSPLLDSVTLHGNRANFNGAAIYNYGASGGQASPTLVNVTINDNHGQSGGGLLNYCGSSGASSPTLTNVTIVGNFATVAGGGLRNWSSGAGCVVTPTLHNVILWGNMHLQMYSENAVPVVGHSIIQGSGGSGGAWDANLGTDAGGNLDADPLLGPLQDNGGGLPTLLPGELGSAIDNGDANACPALDQRGIARPQGAGCDIGAVEVVPDRIFSDGFDELP